jgi:hypothetical protein
VKQYGQPKEVQEPADSKPVSATACTVLLQVTSATEIGAWMKGDQFNIYKADVL